MKLVSIDNGVTGTITVFQDGECLDFFKTPIKHVLNYQKKKSFTNRVDVPKLTEMLFPYCGGKAILERPMVSPKRFVATASALRAFEATLIVLETLNISYEFIDSKEWQKKMLPSGLKGNELKEASMSKAIQLFPQWKDQIVKHGDGDSLLIGLSRL